MARTLSDFAAMSGLPQFALVTLICPADREARWVKATLSRAAIGPPIALPWQSSVAKPVARTVRR